MRRIITLQTFANFGLKTALFIALSISISSCSFKSLYNQLDYLIPSYVEGLVSLDNLLEEKVEQRSLMLIQWHRNTQLGLYAEWFSELQRDANEKLNEQQMLAHIDKLDSFWHSLTQQLNQEMSLLLPLLNADQRNELFDSLIDKNDDFREDYVDIANDERIEQYTARMFDHFETWLGHLDDRQEKNIEQAAGEMQATASFRLQRRQQWQGSIKTILESDNNVSRKTTSLQQFFTDFHSSDNHTLAKLEKINRDILARLIVDIVQTMTSDQQAYFTGKTNDYIRMFNELAEER